MKLNLNKSKDCINCVNAEVYGDKQSPKITCTSPDSLHYSLLEKDGRYCAAYCKGYSEVHDNNENSIRKGNIALEHALKFMLAGKSEFVMHSTKTNQDFTFRITRKISKDDAEKFVYFVNAKMGAFWQYAGLMWYEDKEDKYKYAQGKNGKVEADNLTIRSLLFVINKLHRGETPLHLEVYHTGTCGRCGKKLTTPESILTGLGPECCRKVGIPRVKLYKTTQ